MSRPITKVAVLAASLVAALSAATLAQQPGADRPARAQARPAPTASAAPDSTLVITGQIEWIEKSDVAALRPGKLKSIEVDTGMLVEGGKPFALLHDELAQLGVAKAELLARNVGAEMKAKAQHELAAAELARLERIRKSNISYVPESDYAKANAEVNVAYAMIIDAREAREVAKAELARARQELAECSILAPFDAYVIKRFKHPGESVQANEPVIRLGKLDRVRCYGLVPISDLGRLRVGMNVDVRPTINDADLPIEQKRFRGKIVALGKEVQVVGRTEVEVFADVYNNTAKELFPGLNADMTIYLDDKAIPPPPPDMFIPPVQTAKADDAAETARTEDDKGPGTRAK
ncbi:MAG TPA: efflux RND transporter periplasmic adaptor subunit [Isosphaeraceae bacterium]|jgi:RND family efflux transporter MFP subunit|nr:efflux RND transporter periplasmic adaptor subunit [Isosphaeraceae bacterium]